MIKKLPGTEERVANHSSEYRGVTLEKRTGRWAAQCKIGGKVTSLGTFIIEEEAARAYDRMRLWSCKAGGKKKEEVHLNFPLSDYDDELAALQRLPQEEVIQKLRRAAEQSRSEHRAKAVERPASPGPVAVTCKTAGVGPANFARSLPANYNRRGTLRARTKRTYAGVDSDDDDDEDEGDFEEEEEEEEEQEEHAEQEEAAPGQPHEETDAHGSSSLGTWALKRSRSKPTLPPPPGEAENLIAGPRIRRRHERQPTRVRHMLPGIPVVRCED
jgi:hypothetical protein